MEIAFLCKREEGLLERGRGEENVPDDRKEYPVKAEVLKVDSLKSILQ